MHKLLWFQPEYKYALADMLTKQATANTRLHGKASRKADLTTTQDGVIHVQDQAVFILERVSV